MALEAELGIDIPDSMAGNLNIATFRDLVVHRARRHRAA